MRIVAFSDYRVQDIQRTVEFAATVKPDVILYAGDDVNRFGPLDKPILTRLLEQNRREQLGIHPCQSFDYDGWVMMMSGEIVRIRRNSTLPDIFYFRYSSPNTKDTLISEIPKILRAEANRIPGSNAPELLWRIDEDISVESFLQRASTYSRQTPDGVEGLGMVNAEDYVKKLGDASKYGFGAILGNDDDPIYKTLLNRDNVFDLHETAMRVDGFTIIGQESSSFSDGRGIGHRIYKEEEIEEHLNASLSSVNNSQAILVSHTPPRGLLDRAWRFGKEHIGSHAVRRFISEYEPLLVFCGHVHSHGGCETQIGPTRVINLASHDYKNSPGRVCVVDISDDLKITTRWFLVLHDRVLDYSARMLKEGEIFDSVFNVRGIKGAISQKLDLHNIRTIEDVRKAGVEKLCKCGIGRNRAQRFISSAQAIQTNKAVQHTAVQIPAEPLMFVDIETDIRQSYIWLISVLVEDKHDSFRQFYAKTPTREGEILRDFLSYCKEHQRCTICYYSNSRFDERVIKSQITAHGLDGSNLGHWFYVLQK